MANRRAGGWQGIVGRPGKITKMLLAGVIGMSGGLENSLKFILFWFLSKFFYVHRYKTNIYLKSLCWIKFLPKCNSWGVEIRMPWQQKIWKINQRWGGTSIRHQRVHTYFHLLWEDRSINFLKSFSAELLWRFVLLNNVAEIKIKLNRKHTNQSWIGKILFIKK